MLGGEVEHRLGPVLGGERPADQGVAIRARERPAACVVIRGELGPDAQQRGGEGEGRMGGEDDPERRPLHRRPEGLEGYGLLRLGVAGQARDQIAHDPCIGGGIGLSQAIRQPPGSGQEGAGGQALD